MSEKFIFVSFTFSLEIEARTENVDHCQNHLTFFRSITASGVNMEVVFFEDFNGDEIT
jgi:hypothetical protein